MLPYVDEGECVKIAKGKNKLPTNWKDFVWQLKNIKDGTRND